MVKVPFSSRFVACVLVFALASVSCAVCYAATVRMGDTAHDSCGSMGHEGSAPNTAQMDCCITQSPQFAGIAPGIGVLHVAQPLAFTSIGATPAAFVPTPPALPAFDPDVPKPSGTPTYVLVSVFRL